MRKFLCLILTFLLLFNVLPYNSSNTMALEPPYCTGYIKGLELKTAFNASTAKVCMLDKSGKKNIYDFDDRVTINGSKYSNAMDIIVALQQDTLCEFVLNENNKISALNYDNTPVVYENVLWDSSLSKFNRRDIDALPVFYCIDKEYAEFIDPAPFLSENYVYSIEVYDYAILIKDFASVNYSYTIKNISVSDSVHADLKTSSLACEVLLNKVPDKNNILVGKLYDKNENHLIEEINSTFYFDYTSTEILFNNIPNSDTIYEIKLYVADENGIPVSDTISLDYTIFKTQILTGYTKGFESNTGFNALTARVCMLEQSGKKNIYSFDDSVTINGSKYSNADDILSALQQDLFCEFALNENNKIAALNYDNTPVAYENVLWDSSSSKFNRQNIDALPVFYCIDEEYAEFIDPTPFLSENYIYSIEVYDYAILIKDFASVNYSYTIKDVSVSDSVHADLKTSSLAYEVLLNKMPDKNNVLVGKLYDKNENRFIEEKNSIFDDTYTEAFAEALFDNIPNKDTIYEIKLYVADENGIPVSDTISLDYIVFKSQILAGYIKGIELNESFNGYTARVCILDSSGNKHIYPFDNFATINGSKYFNADDIFSALQQDSFCEFALNENNKISALNYGEASTLSIAYTGNGAVTPLGTSKILKGKEQTITAIPANGWKVGNVKINGVDSATLESFSVLVTADTTIDITFIEISETTPVILTLKTPFIADNKSGSVTFGTVVQGNNTTVKEYGIVYSTVDSIDPQIGKPGCYKLKAETELSIGGHYGIQLIGELLKNTTYYTRSYVIYSHAENTEDTIYGEVIKINLN